VTKKIEISQKRPRNERGKVVGWAPRKKPLLPTKEERRVNWRSSAITGKKQQEGKEEDQIEKCGGSVWR